MFFLAAPLTSLSSEDTIVMYLFQKWYKLKSNLEIIGNMKTKCPFLGYPCTGPSVFDLKVPGTPELAYLKLCGKSDRH